MKRWFWRVLLASVALTSPAASELAEYVARADTHYAWKVVSKETYPQGSVFTVDVVSQQWLTEREVDHPLWEHRMIVYAPSEVRHDTALLLISGGNRLSQLNYKGNRAMMEIARKTRSVTAVLLNVPNQPLVFANDPEKRSRHEDDILAYQWAQYLKSGDAEQLALLPMVKSAVRAMDTITALCAGDQFFLPDSWRFYYDELPQPKHLRYIPNCGHGLDGSESWTLLAFYAAVLNNTPLPDYQWEVMPDGQISVTARTKPLEVKLWQVDNPEKRDFRLDVTGKAWTSAVMESESAADGTSLYRTDVAAPERGWRAFCVELTFPDRSAGKLLLTTGVAVLPDTLPL